MRCSHRGGRREKVKARGCWGSSPASLFLLRLSRLLPIIISLLTSFVPHILFSSPPAPFEVVSQGRKGKRDFLCAPSLTLSFLENPLDGLGRFDGEEERRREKGQKMASLVGGEREAKKSRP